MKVAVILNMEVRRGFHRGTPGGIFTFFIFSVFLVSSVFIYFAFQRRLACFGLREGELAASDESGSGDLGFRALTL